MTLLSVVILPLIGALLVPLLARARSPLIPAIASGIVTLAALSLLLRLAPTVLSGELIISEWSWIPSIGLSVAFRLDALALFFATLITGMGLLIILYAHFYFAGKPGAGRFYALMLAFMGAMLGIVTSENL